MGALGREQRRGSVCQDSQDSFTEVMRSFNKHFTYFHIQFRRRIASRHGRLDECSYYMLRIALFRMAESSHSHNNGHQGRSNWLLIYQCPVSNSTPIQGGPTSLGLLMCPSRDGYGGLIGREARYPGAKGRQARCLPCRAALRIPYKSKAGEAPVDANQMPQGKSKVPMQVCRV